jgi:hypothetical protein
VQLDAPENRSLNARLPFKAIPLTYFYYTGTGRVPTRTAPLLEGAIEGAFPEDAYIWRIEAILRRHGQRSGTELLINQPIVRAWMWQAYRESRMGESIPSASLPEDVSEEYRLHLRELEVRGKRPTRHEYGGIILRTRTGNLHCIFMEGDESSILIRPRGVEIRGNHVGSFHTHPAPPVPGREYPNEEPSDKDLRNSRVDPDARGPESYVIGVYNIYVIFSDGSYRTVGKTGDLLFGGPTS